MAKTSRLALTAFASTVGLLAASASPGSAAIAGHANGYATLSFNSQANINAGAAKTGPSGLGSETGFANTQKDLAGFTFLSDGNGKGAAVKNQAAHIFNNTGSYALVFINSYTYSGCWCGTAEMARPGNSGDLTVTHNNDAALAFATSSSSGTVKTSA